MHYKLFTILNMGGRNIVLSYVFPSTLNQSVSNELDRFVLTDAQFSKTVLWNGFLRQRDLGFKATLKSQRKKLKSNIAISSASGRKADILRLKMINLDILNAVLNVQFISRNFEQCAVLCKMLHCGKQKEWNSILTSCSQYCRINYTNVKNHNARQCVLKALIQARTQETQVIDVISISAKASSSFSWKH